jgi:hypothetical protein
MLIGWRSHPNPTHLEKFFSVDLWVIQGGTPNQTRINWLLRGFSIKPPFQAKFWPEAGFLGLEKPTL